MALVGRRSGVRWTVFACALGSYLDAGVLVTWTLLLSRDERTGMYSSFQVAIVLAALGLAIVAGALLGGRLADRLGRRPILLAGVSFLGAAVGLALLQASFAVLIGVSVVVGIAIGVDLPVACTLLAETSGHRWRAPMLGGMQLFWILGAVVPAILLGLAQAAGTDGIPLLLVHLVLVSVLVFAARFAIPESALWLRARSEHDDSVDTVRARHRTLGHLFGPRYRALVAGLLGFNALGLGAVVVISQYGPYTLLGLVGSRTSQASIFVLLVAPVAVLGALMLMGISLLRRRLVAVVVASLVCAAASLLPVVGGYSFRTWIVTLLLLTLAGSFTGEAMMRIWIQHSFPTQLRTTAQGLVIATGRLAFLLGCAAAPFVLARGVAPAFLAMAALFALSGLTAWLALRRRDGHDAFLTEHHPTGLEAG